MLSEIVLIGFYLAILLYTIIIHEVSHGMAALWLGDKTAKYAGRLNLNPARHIDPWGSIAVPLLMLFMTGFKFAFGWAKPVPFNPYNLRNQRWGTALVAFAGPGINILIAVAFAIAAKLVSLPVALKIDIIRNFDNWSEVSSVIAGSASSIFFEICIIIIFWNALLAFFNLIPIPPLDGSKILFSIFPVKTETMIMLEQFGFILLLFFIILFSGPLGAFLNFVLGIFFSIAV